MNEDFLVTQDTVDQIQDRTRAKLVNSNYNANYNDNVIVVNSSNGDVSITLPLSKGGKEFIVVKSSASNTVAVVMSGSDLVFGSHIVTLLQLGEAKRFKAIPGGYVTL